MQKEFFNRKHVLTKQNSPVVLQRNPSRLRSKCSYLLDPTSAGNTLFSSKSHQALAGKEVSSDTDMHQKRGVDVCET